MNDDSSNAEYRLKKDSEQDVKIRSDMTEEELNDGINVYGKNHFKREHIRI